MSTPGRDRATERRSTPRHLVVVCATALMVGTVLQSSLIPLLPRFAEQHHLTAGELALVAGAYSVGILITALPTGALVARFGSRSVLAAAVALLVVSSAVLVLDSGPTALIASRFVQGVAGCMVWGAAFPWVADVAPRHQQGRLVGVLLSAGVAGGLVGPLVPLIVDTIGHRPTFALLALAAGAVCAACLRLPASSARPRPVLATEQVRGGYGVVALGGWLIVVVGVIVGTAQVMGALRMDAVGGSTTQIAALLITATACQAVLNPLTGLATDRLGPSRPILVGLVAVAATLAVFALPTTPTLQFVVVLLTLCSSTLVWGPAVALMSSAARDARLQQGTVFAVVNLAWATGTLSGTAGSGIVSAAHHQLVATVGLAAVASATAVLAGGVLLRRAGRRGKPVDTAMPSADRPQVSQSR